MPESCAAWNPVTATMRDPELLAPAGTLTKLRYAFAFGADAVYAGMPRYSLRVRENDFVRLPNLAAGINEAHTLGKKFFLACNVLPHNAKVKTFIEDIAPVIALKPDALIMADPGLIMMVRERWPELPVHLSVQANTVNYAAVKFWQSLGVSRIILSRELSIDEIEEIRQQCPEMELEVFVHGALCIAYSGRCLLSGYFNHRDANQGTCTNSCRWEYNVHSAKPDDAGDVVPEQVKSASIGQGERHAESQRVYLLEERERPGEFMPVEEDEHGTYIMNSKDLRAVQHIERLVRIGVDSFKIEGRTKSHYYAARSTQAYRQAIDDAVAGRPFDQSLLGVLENLANRGYTEGFLQRHPSENYQNYEENRSDSAGQRFVGEIVAYDEKTQLAEVAVKNKFAVGDKLELILPSGNQIFELQSMQDADGVALHEVPGGGHTVHIGMEKPGDDLGLIAKFLR